MSSESTLRWRTRLGGSTLPFVDSRIYSERDIFEEERSKIWRNSWLLVAHESELSEPLDFRTTTIAGEPVAIVRGEDGVVRAFLNVCPHRGAVLLREPAGNLQQPNPSGSPKRITCMFHAWQFDAKGHCLSIPRRNAGYQDRLQCSDAGLHQLACEVAYGGFVWVHLDAKPVPLREYMGKAFDAIGPHLEAEPLEVFHHHKAIISTNYKLWHETNSEFYHDYMHHFNRVTSMKQQGYHERHYEAFPFGHATVSSMEVKYTAYEHEQVNLAASRDLSFPLLERNGWKLLDLFPAITLNLRGSALRIDTATPLSEGRVLIEFRGLGLKRDTAEEREQRVRDHNTIWGPFGRNLPEDLLGVTNQTLGMWPGSQGLHVLHGRKEDARIHDEIGLRHYYDEWSKRLGRSASDPYGERTATVAPTPLRAGGER
ncbi:MAG TPA: aromatic ring-hydroxylating dioxygenase subunit alpha [Polyangiaceae bacterium]|jgi:methanesulfonate monooxygenase large subunit|nr:aromatic ring-hydroxylating dioxygenase subunit alpha [Polyangiaceae bacterium]